MTQLEPHGNKQLQMAIGPQTWHFGLNVCWHRRKTFIRLLGTFTPDCTGAHCLNTMSTQVLTQPSPASTPHSWLHPHLTRDSSHTSLMTPATPHSWLHPHLTRDSTHTSLVTPATPHSWLHPHLTRDSSHTSLVTPATPHSWLHPHLTRDSTHTSLVTPATPHSWLHPHLTRDSSHTSLMTAATPWLHMSLGVYWIKSPLLYLFLKCGAP